MHITFDAGGSLKLAKKHDTPSADLTGEIRIRQALSRRSRAFDLANLCGYQQMEMWHEKLFEILQRQHPNHCIVVTMQQIREADKMLSSSCLTGPSLFSSRWKLCSMIPKSNISQKVAIVQGPMIILPEMIRAI